MTIELCWMVWSRCWPSDPRFIILAALGTGEEVIDFFKKDQPDILLTDYSLPGISRIGPDAHHQA